MSYSRERVAMSVSGVNSDIYNQRSYNYTNSSYYTSDLGLSTISSSTGTVRPLKNTKNYLKDIECKFNQDPDPRADLQLLSRYKNNSNNVHYTGTMKIEKDIKDDEVPQIFRKMQPANGQEAIQQRTQIFQSSPVKKNIIMSQQIAQDQQQNQFKILNYNYENNSQIKEEPKKGFFEKLFSFAETNENKSNQQIKMKNYRQPQNIQNMNDVESSLVNLRQDMINNINNQNVQFNFTFQMKQQLSIAIDLTDRVLREQSTPILNQILKSINRARYQAKQQLYTSEQQLMETFYENLEFLTQQKILKLKVHHLPTQEQDYEERQMFYQQASQYILNSKGYYPTKQQLDYFFEEIKHLKVNNSEWMDFLSKRI
ncbi:hypothetical protein TTHERM_00429820 (macronuclear) [Tetrahymena thermophila SB210]|uniref:Uncharacterized protein n=1 Tax=Tetrahymena thermophila (strain SB210) TaxID=312017 RepID=Q231H8_TETTS|nr:hypothetical protein TTHERM_00429820 [Tetrahymena thermophila SB210]EAR91061.1 hypothetical protein TTHERM_00429820 [Tetrahymena thermophila SB210]|eukprot:XP_001011306.1 hypothetical protein TTHERM_00429820 [Tetrahymena thermophila SB210]